MWRGEEIVHLLFSRIYTSNFGVESINKHYTMPEHVEGRKTFLLSEVIHVSRRDENGSSKN